MKSSLKVGDRVRYSTKFLRSISAYTGDLPFARGEIEELKPIGRSELLIATIKWDRAYGGGDEGSAARKVLVSNLERI